MAQRRTDAEVIADARTAFCKALGTDYGTADKRRLIVESNMAAGADHFNLGHLEQALAHYEAAMALDYGGTYRAWKSVDAVKAAIAAKK